MPKSALIVCDMISAFDFEDGERLLESAREAAPGKRMEAAGLSFLDELRPDEGAPFIVKGRHSIFYGTSVEHLLREMGVERIVLAGQVTEQCILYSALDAHLRHFSVVVPRDGLAHIEPRLAEAALEMMERNLHAEVVDAAEVSF